MVLARRQVIFGLSVVAAGICCALPFQKVRPRLPVTAASGITQSASEFVWVDEGVTLQVAGQDQSSPASGLYRQARSGEEVGVTAPPVIRKHASLADRGPSELQADGADVPLRPDETLPVDASIEDAKKIPRQPAVTEGANATPWQWYTIRAGDTLAGVAQRFLGDSQEMNRIQDLNQDRLVDTTRPAPGLRIRVPLSRP